MLTAKLLREVKSLIDANVYGDALWKIANALDLSDIADEISNLNIQHLRLGYLSDKLEYQRNHLKSQLLSAAADVVSPAELTTIRKMI